MEKLTIGLIHTLKREGTTDYDIDKYLRKYYSYEGHYDRAFIDRKLREACVDYITNGASDPIYELNRYFLSEHSFYMWEEPEHNVMIRFLAQIQVCKDNCYINGFTKENWQ